MDMAHERNASSDEEVMAVELRRGAWTVEEDLLLVNYIAVHGEGRWNWLTRSAGLNRAGKSGRLRWLNYLRPNIRRGSITPQEQLLILQLHSQWGNRWSKIAQRLPGRTDNEIKNYWRTRVQKHAKKLKCDVNSQRFKDVMLHLWMPRLVERIQASASAAGAEQPTADTPPSWQHCADGVYAWPELPGDACWPAEYFPAVGGQLSNTAVPELLSTTVPQPSWPATVDGADQRFSSACDTDLIQQQAPCQLGEAWTSEALPELGATDFDIGSFDVESIWNMDDLWYTQAQGI